MLRAWNPEDIGLIGYEPIYSAKQPELVYHAQGWEGKF